MTFTYLVPAVPHPWASHLMSHTNCASPPGQPPGVIHQLESTPETGVPRWRPAVTHHSTSHLLPCAIGRHRCGLTSLPPGRQSRVMMPCPTGEGDRQDFCAGTFAIKNGCERNSMTKAARPCRETSQKDRLRALATLQPPYRGRYVEQSRELDTFLSSAPGRRQLLHSRQRIPRMNDLYCLPLDYEALFTILTYYRLAVA